MTTRQYTYDIARHDNGAPLVCRSATLGVYLNVVAIVAEGSEPVRNRKRTIARCRTVADAVALVDALNRYSLA